MGAGGMKAQVCLRHNAQAAIDQPGIADRKPPEIAFHHVPFPVFIRRNGRLSFQVIHGFSHVSFISGSSPDIFPILLVCAAILQNMMSQNGCTESPFQRRPRNVGISFGIQYKARNFIGCFFWISQIRLCTKDSPLLFHGMQYISYTAIFPAQPVLMRQIAKQIQMERIG